MPEPRDQVPRVSASPDRFHHVKARGNGLSRRVRHACRRCRKQKLRCDDERPCQLCVRAQKHCEDTPQTQRRTKRSTWKTTPQSFEGDVRDVRDASSPIEVPSAPGTPSFPRPPATTSPVPPWQVTTSTFKIVEQVFKSHHVDSDPRNDSDAIPDSRPTQGPPALASMRTRKVSAVLGMDLPRKDIVQLLVHSYLDEVDWYLCLFHERTLWARLNPILDSGHVKEGQEAFLMVLLIVLVSGATYIRPKGRECLGPSVNLAQLQVNIMHKIEEKVTLVLDESSTDSVTFLYLLCSHNLYNNRPARAFILFGAAVRAAQAIGLYNENLWGTLNEVDRETRRRIWWTLYISDGFMAQVYGRPTLIDEAHFHVGALVDIDDNSMRCPGFESMEVRDDGSLRPVTIHSYPRLRARLYLIAAPMTHQITALKTGSKGRAMREVSKVHQHLVDWEQKLPPELRLKSFSRHRNNSEMDSVSHTFRLQALGLQISYDNIQLLLHRLMLSWQGSSFGFETQLAQGVEEDSDKELEIDPSTVGTSKKQCWASAIRTSKLIEHVEAWEAACSSPLGGQVGMQSFTAGVMLGIFALSNPLSRHAQEAKLGIARIIKMSQTPAYKAEIWAQVTKLLKDLLRLILTEEMKALLSTSTEIGTMKGPSTLTGPHIDVDVSNNTTDGVANQAADSANATQTEPSRHPTQSIDTPVGSNDLVVADSQLEYAPSVFWPNARPDSDFGEAFPSLQNVFTNAFPSWALSSIHPSTTALTNPSTADPTHILAANNASESDMHWDMFTGAHDSALGGNFDQFEF